MGAAVDGRQQKPLTRGPPPAPVRSGPVRSGPVRSVYAACGRLPQADTIGLWWRPCGHHRVLADAAYPCRRLSPSKPVPFSSDHVPDTSKRSHHTAKGPSHRSTPTPVAQIRPQRARRRNQGPFTQQLASHAASEGSRISEGRSKGPCLALPCCKPLPVRLS